LRFWPTAISASAATRLLLVEKPTQAGVDFRYRIFNADGGEVEQCGNGARCFVRFVHEQGLTDKREIRVETMKGVIAPRLRRRRQCHGRHGRAAIFPAEIPFLLRRRCRASIPLDVADETLAITAVSMGNPHAVQVVPMSIGAGGEQGPLIESHPRFPRGSTPASCRWSTATPSAARVRARRRRDAGLRHRCLCRRGRRHPRGLLDSPVRVTTRGGELTIAWGGPGSRY
jgi:diaminopimelate epimerase